LLQEFQRKEAKQWGGVHEFGVKREKEELVLSLLKVKWRQNELSWSVYVNKYPFLSIY
jgi:hypothetical protein